MIADGEDRQVVGHSEVTVRDQVDKQAAEEVITGQDPGRPDDSPEKVDPAGIDDSGLTVAGGVVADQVAGLAAGIAQGGGEGRPATGQSRTAAGGEEVAVLEAAGQEVVRGHFADPLFVDPHRGIEAGCLGSDAHHRPPPLGEARVRAIGADADDGTEVTVPEPLGGVGMRWTAFQQPGQLVVEAEAVDADQDLFVEGGGSEAEGQDPRNGPGLAPAFGGGNDCHEASVRVHFALASIELSRSAR